MRIFTVILFSFFVFACSSDKPDKNLSAEQSSFNFINHMLSGDYNKSLLYIYGFDQLSMLEKNMIRSEFRKMSENMHYRFGNDFKIKKVGTNNSGDYISFYYELYIGNKKVMEYPINVTKTSEGWRVIP